LGIFNKPVATIQHAHLYELIGSPESAILEYKQAVHEWDDITKELVAFANTFGGHLILGAEDDKSGRLKSLPGVEPIRGFDQLITDRCFGGVVPPLTPFPSAAITLPDTARVAYVIHVPASYSAPHFLVNRGGAYVRVQTQSKKYEPRLAEWGELLRLADRRRLAVDQRNSLRERARERARPILRPNNVAMEIFASPSFPVQPLAELVALREVTVDPNAPAIRSGTIGDDVVAATESITCSRVRNSEPWLYHELTIYGSIYTAARIGLPPLGSVAGPQLAELLGVLEDTLLWLAHAQYAFQRFGYDGPVTASLTIRHAPGHQFIWSGGGAMGDPLPTNARFDDTINQELDTTTAAWQARLRADAWSLFLPIAYATDMREILTTDRTKRVQQAVARLEPRGIAIP
jgi:hypothetical protein